MTTGPQYTLEDSRDNKSYTIAKLADGKVWMTQNLDLDLDDNTTYTNQNTDLGWNGSSYSTASWTPERSTYTSSDTFSWGMYNDSTQSYDGFLHPESYDPGNQYWNGTTSNWSDWGEYMNSCNNGACNDSLYPLSTYVTTSNNSIPQYHLGNYYNWSAAVATNNSNIFNNTDVADQSICPAGWTLPSGSLDSNDNSEGDYVDLWTEYGWTSSGFNSTSTLTSAPFYYIPSGTIEAYQADVGFDNSFWTSSAFYNSDALRVYFHTQGSGTVNPVQIVTRYYGGTVRCVARP